MKEAPSGHQRIDRHAASVESFLGLLKFGTDIRNGFDRDATTQSLSEELELSLRSSRRFSWFGIVETRSRQKGDVRRSVLYLLDAGYGTAVTPALSDEGRRVRDLTNRIGLLLSPTATLDVRYLDASQFDAADAHRIMLKDQEDAGLEVRVILDSASSR